MSTPQVRNRMVVFRLTQEEYENLRSVCSARGGRSLSDFTRSELMSFLGTDSLGGMIDSRFSEIKHRLGELQESIGRLAILVSDARKAGEEIA